MRGLRRAIPLVSFAAALTVASCAFPTDKSDQIIVILQTPSQVVLRGQEISVYAQAFHVVGIDTQPVTNVDFSFSSGSSNTATVQNDGGGYATVTGVNSGTVDIIARAIAFERAQQGDLVLRVANPLEIDSVRPALAHHGEILTVYGVGVDSMFLASLAGVNLIEYPFSRQRDTATGLGRISFWVPPPARTDRLFYLGAGVFGQTTDTTKVKFEDVFEPNDTVPTNIDLDVPGPWPGTILAPIIFANPALAFEPVERSKSGEDWYRFHTANTNQALTFFITYPSISGDTGIRVFLIDSLYYMANGDPTKDPIEKFAGRDSADFIGTAFYRCKGFTFGPPQASRESTTVALKTLPNRALHLLTNFSRAQRYGLTVARGYFTADPRIGPDAYEENDLCTYADSGNRRITLSTTFSDTLTIDNPHDIDWLRIDLPGTGPVSVRLRTLSRPFPGAALADSSDIDLYLLTTPNPSTGQGLNVVAFDTTAGSSNDITTTLIAGNSYYIAVVDFAGVPARYSLCMARGLALCTPIPSASMSPATHPAVTRRGPPKGPTLESAPAGVRSLFRRSPPP